MDTNRTMHAKDVVSAKLASCVINNLNGERFLLMQAKNLEAKAEKNKVEGTTGINNRKFSTIPTALTILTVTSSTGSITNDSAT